MRADNGRGVCSPVQGPRTADRTKLLIPMDLRLLSESAGGPRTTSGAPKTFAPTDRPSHHRGIVGYMCNLETHNSLATEPVYAWSVDDTAEVE
jgi:hypothetical protein